MARQEDSRTVRTFILPWPPSTNAIWKSWHGRPVLSPEAREFYRKAGPLIDEQRSGEVMTGRVVVELWLYPPNNCAFDIDNRVKVVLDALTKHKVWRDDNQVDILGVMRCDSMDDGEVRVYVEEFEDVRHEEKEEEDADLQ